jgi:hypothetical protein
MIMKVADQSFALIAKEAQGTDARRDETKSAKGPPLRPDRDATAARRPEEETNNQRDPRNTQKKEKYEQRTEKGYLIHPSQNAQNEVNFLDRPGQRNPYLCPLVSESVVSGVDSQRMPWRRLISWNCVLC